MSDRLGQPLPRTKALRIVEQIADALDYAHGRGILHCDVKPANTNCWLKDHKWVDCLTCLLQTIYGSWPGKWYNILIDEQDWIYLTDFGLARITDESKRTKSGVRASGRAYLSPQQKWHLPAEIWPVVHVLKLILGEILTGRVPYAGTPAYISLEQGADLSIDARTSVFNSLMPLLSTRPENSGPYLLSRSRMTYFGPLPQGVASRNCCLAHSSVGERVTAICTIRRLCSSMITKMSRLRAPHWDLTFLILSRPQRPIANPHPHRVTFGCSSVRPIHTPVKFGSAAALRHAGSELQ